LIKSIIDSIEGVDLLKMLEWLVKGTSRKRETSKGGYFLLKKG
jgi:hypothetical protein